MIGAATLWPAIARAQQPTLPVIGYMSGRSPDDSRHLIAAFQQGLRDTGFVEGKNVAVEYQWASGRYDQLPSLAADLVKRVGIIVAVGGDVSAVAAMRATKTTPIVFGMGGDPVKAGLSKALAGRVETRQALRC